MKRLCILLLLLLLTGCGGKVDGDIYDRAVAVENNGYFRADEDFAQTNFETADTVKEATVYLSKNSDGTEYGFFRLYNSKDAAAAEGAIRAYLAEQRQSVETLAALYPADDLQKRLDRFDRAVVGHTGNMVYYFLTDGDTASETLKKLK